MFVIKIFSFILDILPVVGGIKMLLEAFAGKEMGGTVLVGNARTMQFLFGIISLILDVTTGIFGSIARGTIRIVTLGLFKKTAQAGVKKTLQKGFLKRGLAAASKRTGTGVISKGFQGAARAVERATEAKILGIGVGKFAVGAAERKIRTVAKNTASDIYGARVNRKKRHQMYEKYGVTKREDVIAAQKVEKVTKDDSIIQNEWKDLKKEGKSALEGATFQSVLAYGAGLAPKGSQLGKALSGAENSIKGAENNYFKKQAIRYAEKKTKEIAVQKYTQIKDKIQKERDIIIEAQKRRKLAKIQNEKSEI